MKRISIPLLLLVLAGAGRAAPAEDGVPTPDQRRKYAAATAARDEAEKPLLEKQRAGLAKIREMIAAGSDGREFERELDELRSLSGRIRDVEARYEETLAKSFSSTQRAKLAAAAAAVPAVKGDGVPGDEEEQE